MYRFTVKRRIPEKIIQIVEYMLPGLKLQEMEAVINERRHGEIAGHSEAHFRWYRTWIYICQSVMKRVSSSLSTARFP